MKANLFAAVLSFCVLSFPLPSYAQEAISNQPSSNQKLTEKIDLNKADLKRLSKSFKGIGLKRAQAIIKYRESHGGFKSVADLAQVPGVGQQFVKRNLLKLQEIFVVN